MAELPPTVHTRSPDALAADRLARVPVQSLLRAGMLLHAGPAHAAARLADLPARELVAIVERDADLPSEVVAHLLEIDDRVTVRRALWHHAEMDAALAERELLVAGGQMDRATRQRLLGCLPADRVLRDDGLRRWASACSRTTQAVWLRQALHRTARNPTDQLALLGLDLPTSVLTEALEGIFGSEPVLHPDTITAAAGLLAHAPQTTATHRRLLEAGYRALERDTPPTPDQARRMLAALAALGCGRSADHARVATAALALALSDTWELTAAEVLELTGCDAVPLLRAADPGHHPQVLTLLADLPPVTTQGTSWVPALRRHLVEAEGADPTADDEPAARRAGDRLHELFAPLRDPQPWLAALAGHHDLAAGVLAAADPTHRSPLLEQLSRHRVLRRMDQDQLCEVLGLGLTGFDQRARAELAKRLVPDQLTAAVVELLVAFDNEDDTFALALSKVLLDERVDHLDDRAVLAAARGLPRPDLIDVLAQRSFADPDLELAVWEAATNYHQLQALRWLARPLDPAVAAGLVARLPDAAVAAVVAGDAPDSLLAAVRTAAPCSLLLRKDRAAAGAFISDHLAANLGDDIAAWDTALSLLTDWTGSLDELVEATVRLRAEA